MCSVGPSVRGPSGSELEVDDVDALFAEYSAAGVSFAQRLQPEAWGGRDFIVLDPDGNAICFAGRTP